jgi:predicted adenylyl cyclase CyaB
MNIVNLEVKCAVDDSMRIVKLLENKNAFLKGEDSQTDTYFNVESGRLKIRQGEIENFLIYYFRPESKNVKRSVVRLQALPKENAAMVQILSMIHGVKIVVSKKRLIYYIDNVKFHIDSVEHLGHFVEIEACDQEGKYSESYLRSQCDYYIDYLGLHKEDFINLSYSDMLASVSREVQHAAAH